MIQAIMCGILIYCMIPIVITCGQMTVYIEKAFSKGRPNFFPEYEDINWDNPAVRKFHDHIANRSLVAFVLLWPITLRKDMELLGLMMEALIEEAAPFRIYLPPDKDETFKQDIPK